MGKVNLNFWQGQRYAVWNSVELETKPPALVEARDAIENYRQRFHPYVKPEFLMGVFHAIDDKIHVAMLQKIPAEGEELMFESHEEMREYNSKPLDERSSKIRVAGEYL